MKACSRYSPMTWNDVSSASRVMSSEAISPACPPPRSTSFSSRFLPTSTISPKRCYRWDSSSTYHSQITFPETTPKRHRIRIHTVRPKEDSGRATNRRITCHVGPMGCPTIEIQRHQLNDVSRRLYGREYLEERDVVESSHHELQAFCARSCTPFLAAISVSLRNGGTTNRNKLARTPRERRPDRSIRYTGKYVSVSPATVNYTTSSTKDSSPIEDKRSAEANGKQLVRGALQMCREFCRVPLLRSLSDTKLPVLPATVQTQHLVLIISGFILSKTQHVFMTLPTVFHQRTSSATSRCHRKHLVTFRVLYYHLFVQYIDLPHVNVLPVCPCLNTLSSECYRARDTDRAIDGGGSRT
jgi:hypothetical protein